MQYLQDATRTEAVNELVQRLADDVRKTRGGNPISSKLRQTAVGVLVGRPQVTVASHREKVRPRHSFAKRSINKGGRQIAFTETGCIWEV